MFDENIRVTIQRFPQENRDPQTQLFISALLDILNQPEHDIALFAFFKELERSPQKKEIKAIFKELWQQQIQDFNERRGLQTAVEQITQYQTTRNPLYLIGIPVDVAVNFDENANLFALFQRLAARAAFLTREEYQFPGLQTKGFPENLRVALSGLTLSELVHQQLPIEHFIELCHFPQLYDVIKNPDLLIILLAFAPEVLLSLDALPLRMSLFDGQTESLKLLSTTYLEKGLLPTFLNKVDWEGAVSFVFDPHFLHSVEITTTIDPHFLHSVEIITTLLSLYSPEELDKEFSKNMQSILRSILHGGSINKLTLLLACNSPDLIFNALTDYSYALLGVACFSGHIEMVKRILELYGDAERAKALVNVANPPLFYARSHPGVVNYLLTHYDTKEQVQTVLYAKKHYIVSTLCREISIDPDSNYVEGLQLLLAAYSDKVALQHAMQAIKAQRKMPPPPDIDPAFYGDRGARQQRLSEETGKLVNLLTRVYCSCADTSEIKSSRIDIKKTLLKQLVSSKGPLIQKDLDTYPDIISNALDQGINERLQASAAEVFADVVLLNDDYLGYKKPNYFLSFFNIHNEQDALKQRFFNIALRLPIELQMILCNRLFGLDSILIPSEQRESALMQGLKN